MIRIKAQRSAELTLREHQILGQVLSQVYYEVICLGLQLPAPIPRVLGSFKAALFDLRFQLENTYSEHADWPRPTPYFQVVVGPNEILIIPDVADFVRDRVIAPLEATLKLIEGRVPNKVLDKGEKALRAGMMLG